MTSSQLSIPSSINKPVEKLEKGLFSSWLIDWYQVHKRPLPWRETNDPYKIWLSEIILQQTRVAQGLPYYQKFVSQYPVVQALAQAEEEAILRIWQGLGYYARARNLHACARAVVNKLGGKFPNNYKELLQLPGVGPYTAAAIASIAFKESVSVVDGNVYRVLARVFGIEKDIMSTQGKKTLHELAQLLVPQENAGLYNQAIMEFGALNCTPVKPKCPSCTFKNHCIAFYTGRQSMLPVKSRKIKIKKQYLHYFVIQSDDRLYMRRRKAEGVWGGMYDFYLIEDSQFRTTDLLDDALLQLMRRHKLPFKKNPMLYKHLLTHRQLYVRFFHVQATTEFIEEATPFLIQKNVNPYAIDEIKMLPKPTLVDNFLKEKFYN